MLPKTTHVLKWSCQRQENAYVNTTTTLMILITRIEMEDHVRRVERESYENVRDLLKSYREQITSFRKAT